MTFFFAFAVLLLAAATLLVFAGREFLRVNGFPRHRVHHSATWSTSRRWATQPSTSRRTRPPDVGCAVTEDGLSDCGGCR